MKPPAAPPPLTAMAERKAKLEAENIEKFEARCRAKPEADRKLPPSPRSFLVRKCRTRAEKFYLENIDLELVEQLGFVLIAQWFFCGSYHADFAFLRNTHATDRVLIVELDGQTHTTSSAKTNDNARDERSRAFGYEVLRFTDKQVLNDVASCVRRTMERLMMLRRQP